MPELARLIERANGLQKTTVDLLDEEHPDLQRMRLAFWEVEAMKIEMGFVGDMHYLISNFVPDSPNAELDAFVALAHERMIKRTVGNLQWADVSQEQVETDEARGVVAELRAISSELIELSRSYTEQTDRSDASQ